MPGDTAGHINVRKGKVRVFFSEEKKQKTFVSAPPPGIPAMAGWIAPGQT
jgi:hypothetical protein